MPHIAPFSAKFCAVDLHPTPIARHLKAEVRAAKHVLNEKWDYQRYKITSMSTHLTILQVIGYSCLMLPLAMVFWSMSHELGHTITILLQGGSIVNIEVFPLALFIPNPPSPIGYVTWNAGSVWTSTNYLWVDMAGVISSQFWALTILLLVTRYQFNPVIELLGFWCVVLFSCDLLYPIIDWISFHSLAGSWFSDAAGDWSKAYAIIPWLQWIAVITATIWIVCLVWFFTVRKNRARFEF
jgi:hypothetical protein